MVTNKKKEKWYLRASVLKIKSHGLIKLHIYLIIESERQQTEIRQLLKNKNRKRYGSVATLFFPDLMLK
jgi:hypothetical protein